MLHHSCETAHLAQTGGDYYYYYYFTIILDLCATADLAQAGGDRHEVDCEARRREGGSRAHTRTVVSPLPTQGNEGRDSGRDLGT